MTVQSDLQKAVAQCQSLLGTYQVCETSTQDQVAKTMFKELGQDIQRHIDHLNNRLSYLEKNNPMYQQRQQAKQ